MSNFVLERIRVQLLFVYKVMRTIIDVYTKWSESME